MVLPALAGWVGWVRWGGEEGDPWWGKPVGRGGGKSGFVETSLFRGGPVVLPDFSHSSLVWGPEAQSVDGWGV